jgi:hypothetical protein
MREHDVLRADRDCLVDGEHLLDDAQQRVEGRLIASRQPRLFGHV